MSHRFHPYKNNLLFLLSFNIIGIHLNIFRILQLTMRLAWRARDNNYTQQKYKVWSKKDQNERAAPKPVNGTHCG